MEVLSHQSVIYLHSKGSYRPFPNNDKLRRFLTRGALSNECASIHHTSQQSSSSSTTTSTTASSTACSVCNVCSSRMSPIPHSHTPGNMWLAKCNYIQYLYEPYQFENVMGTPNACLGSGRYAAEHWVHSHPSNQPCDLYTNPTYVWGFEGIPSMEQFESHLQLDAAPRFLLDAYEIPHGACFHNGPWIRARIREYQRLYGIDKPDDDWWGWEFFNVSADDYS